MLSRTEWYLLRQAINESATLTDSQRIEMHRTINRELEPQLTDGELIDLWNME